MGPRLIIFDVPKDLDALKLVQFAFAQKESVLAGIAEEEFKDGFLPKFKVGKREDI